MGGLRRIEEQLATPGGRRLALLAAVCSLVLAVGLLNLTRVSSASLRSMVETAAAIVWLIAVAILWRGFHETRQLRLLAVIFCLVVLGTVDVAATFAPAALGKSTPVALSAAPALAIPVAAIFMLWGARLPRSALLRRGSLAERAGLLLALLAAGGAGLLSWIWAGSMDVQAGRPGLLVLPLVFSFCLLLAAVVMFLGEFRIDAGRTTGYLAAACLMLAAGALKRVFVSETAGALAQSPTFRLAAFGLIAVGGLHVLADRRAELRRIVVADERDRLARDLHDGLCQDLAFIASQASRVVGDREAEPIVVAARRALAASREMLADLSPGAAGDLYGALRTVADELMLRFGITIELDVLEVPMAAGSREDLARIVREAVVNAVKHGDARNVVVQLRVDEAGRLALRVLDDGAGTAPQRWQEGFGIGSMRRRAASLGARLEARPGPSGGGEVLVTWD